MWIALDEICGGRKPYALEQLDRLVMSLFVTELMMEFERAYDVMRDRVHWVE